MDISHQTLSAITFAHWFAHSTAIGKRIIAGRATTAALIEAFADRTSNRLRAVLLGDTSVTALIPHIVERTRTAEAVALECANWTLRYAFASVSTLVQTVSECLVSATNVGFLGRSLSVCDGLCCSRLPTKRFCCRVQRRSLQTIRIMPTIRLSCSRASGWGSSGCGCCGCC